jgi:hypothetical protein
VKECPVCKRKIKHLNAKHIKNCFGDDKDYKIKYIVHNFPLLKDKDKIESLYNGEKYSIPMICSYAGGADNKSVCNILKYYGIKIRTIKETRKLKEYKERFESTNIKRYGAINPLSKGTTVFHKRNQTVLDRYGCENVFQRLDLFIEEWNNSGPKSKISYLNKQVYAILDELGYKYKPEFCIKYKDETGKARWKYYDAKVDNLLIEANGNYWHANPDIYDEEHEFIFPGNCKTKAKDIWKLDIYKIEIAKQNGFDVLTIWESEFNKSIENVKQKIKDKINKENQRRC